MIFKIAGAAAVGSKKEAKMTLKNATLKENSMDNAKIFCWDRKNKLIIELYITSYEAAGEPVLPFYYLKRRF